MDYHYNHHTDASRSNRVGNRSVLYVTKKEEIVVEEARGIYGDIRDNVGSMMSTKSMCLIIIYT